MAAAISAAAISAAIAAAIATAIAAARRTEEHAPQLQGHLRRLRERQRAAAEQKPQCSGREGKPPLQRVSGEPRVHKSDGDAGAAGMHEHIRPELRLDKQQPARPPVPQEAAHRGSAVMRPVLEQHARPEALHRESRQRSRRARRDQHGRVAAASARTSGSDEQVSPMEAPWTHSR